MARVLNTHCHGLQRQSKRWKSNDVSFWVSRPSGSDLYPTSTYIIKPSKIYRRDEYPRCHFLCQPEAEGKGNAVEDVVVQRSMMSAAVASNSQPPTFGDDD